MCHFPVTSSGLVVLWKRLEQLLKLTSRSVTSMLNHCDKLCHSWTAIANDDDVYSDRLCHWLLRKRDKSELQCVKFATADLGGVRGCGGSLWQGSLWIPENFERFLYHCSSSVCSLAFIVWPSLLSVKRHCMHLFCTRQWILSQLERRLKRGNDQKQRKEATSAQNSLERRYNLWLSVWFLFIPREKQICQRIFVKVILSESAL